MTVRDIVMAAAGSMSKTYVDDVFSTYLYDGNGTSQTINNGINLAGNGGMVWIKSRNATLSHQLYDTARGVSNRIFSNTTDGTSSISPNGVSAFNSNGFNVTGSLWGVNTANEIYASWTFRKAPKFFDVVTYTGTGTSNRLISHSLGIVPGIIIVKNLTSSTFNWRVYHKDVTPGNDLILNTTASEASAASVWGSTPTAPTESGFYVGSNVTVNQSGQSYVAYLFAHDNAADGLIQCGSYTGNGSTSGPSVNLGWEPQWLLIKAAGSAQNWHIFDEMRGMVPSAQAVGEMSYLYPNSSNTEVRDSSPLVKVSATGFSIGVTSASVNENGTKYVYMAIRRPNKPPTSGTKVFQPTLYTGTNTDNRLINTGITPDMVWLRQRSGAGEGYSGFVVGDRLRGQAWLKTGSSQFDQIFADALDQQLVFEVEYGTAFSSMTGVWVGNNSGVDPAVNVNADTTSNNHIALAFKRAPGFLDIVCYNGTGGSITVPHNLGVAPELIITKSRASLTFNWLVTYNFGATSYSGAQLNLTDASFNGAYNANGSISARPTASNIFFGDNQANWSGTAYVAYLFASLPGISKVGTYTGNGGNLTINCGFSTGARFVMIKRTNVASDWFVFDTARGIAAGSGNDAHLRANGSSAEFLAASLSTDNSGFIVTQQAIANVNVSGSTYLYLAIA